MAKVISWSPEEFKLQLNERLKQAVAFRNQFEQGWCDNAALVYNASSDVAYSINDINAYADDYAGDSEISSNYVFKYIRFLHSQMSANPPSVVVRPNSGESKDKHSADAADRILRYAFKHHKIQEQIDRVTLKALVRGTGFIKVYWDVDGGDVYDFDEETGDITMEGAIRMYSPSLDDLYIDPLAKTWEDVRFIFERVQLNAEQVKFKYPNKWEMIKEKLDKERKVQIRDKAEASIFEIYCYYEKGLPVNGMAGRYVECLEDGTVLSKPRKNMHWKARLPFIPLTDVDVEDVVYGKSNIEYIARLQEQLNRFDSASVDAMQAHGVCRMAVHKNCELSDDVLNNDNYDVIEYDGDPNTPAPHFVQPPMLPPDLPRIREQLKLDIQEIVGINDAMLGIQKREQSGFSQQTSIEAGNMTRRRLFNKYSAFVEDLYRHYLGLVTLHWDEEKQVAVVGKEKAFEVKYLSKADLTGGYDLVVEYGTSLPLEPAMRREVIMLLQPLLEQAGVSPRSIISWLKLNDLEGVHDTMGMAADRQREIFDKMLEEDIYIEPDEFEDHEAMLEYANTFVMTNEYTTLSDDHKELIKQHIRDRMAAMEQAMGGGEEAPAPTEGAMPPPPMPGNIPQM